MQIVSVKYLVPSLKCREMCLIKLYRIYNNKRLTVSGTNVGKYSAHIAYIPKLYRRKIYLS